MVESYSVESKLINAVTLSTEKVFNKLCDSETIKTTMSRSCVYYSIRYSPFAYAGVSGS